MITCSKCSKDNQDHYKFCLGCGAELPRDAAPKPFSPQTPPHGMKAAQPVAASPAAGASGGASGAAAFGATVATTGSQRPPAPAAAAPAASPTASASASAAAPVTASTAAKAGVAGQSPCPQCSHMNNPTNLFCGSCGFRLTPAAAPKAQPAADVAPVAAGAMSLTALRADGSEAGTFGLSGTTVSIGRETGGIFAGDSYLSPKHATFRILGGGRAMVKDEGSLNGVYKRLARDAPLEVKPNDIFRIGQEIVRFEPLTTQAPSAEGVERLGAPAKGYVGRIALVIGREETGNAFPIPENGVHLGRERGDILFPEDGYVSGLHCRLAWEQGKLLLTDLGSSNGTFLRIREETEVRTGDILLMGQQLFRINA